MFFISTMQRELMHGMVNEKSRSIIIVLQVTALFTNMGEVHSYNTRAVVRKKLYQRRARLDITTKS